MAGHGSLVTLTEESGSLRPERGESDPESQASVFRLEFRHHPLFASLHSKPAQVAESVDAADLKSAVRKDVRVQVPPWAPRTIRTMKAANYLEKGQVEVGDSVPVAPKSGEVRLDVGYCGICGTDMHIYQGHMDSRIQTPLTIGHEVSATVAELGEGVTSVEVGDRVAVRPLNFGEAHPFDKGHAHVGKNLKFIGIDAPGGMQHSWTVPAHTLHKLPDGVSLEHGALAEPAAVACHDVRLGRVKEGEAAVVIGGGPIGILVALVAKEKGARVIVSEINDKRLEKIDTLGLETVNPLKEDLAETISSKTNEAMADVVFEVSGSQPGVDAMTSIVNVRGRIVVVGIHPQPRQIDLLRFFWSELELIGTRLYEEEDFEEALALMGEGKLPIEELITKVYPIDHVKEAFQTIENHPEGIKYLVKCDE